MQGSNIPFISSLALVFLIFCTACQKPQIKPLKELNTHLVFKIPAKNLALIPNGSAQEDPDAIIELTVPGALFDKPLVIQSIDKTRVDRSTPEGASASVFSADKAGDEQWILSNWSRAQRDDLAALYQSKEAVGQHQQWFSAIEKKEALGYFYFQEHLGYLLRYEQNGDSSPIVEFYIKEDDSWRLTLPPSDPKLESIQMAAMSGAEVEERFP